MSATISAISTPGWPGAGLAVSLIIAPSAPLSISAETSVNSWFPLGYGKCTWLHLRQIIKDHEMGFFDYHVGKHRRLPAGVLFALRHTLRDIQFLEQIGV